MVADAVVVSLGIVAVGWVVGITIGLLLALLMARLRLAEWGLLPVGRPEPDGAR